MILRLFCLLVCSVPLIAQESGSISGKVISQNSPVPFGIVVLKQTTLGAVTDTNGFFEIRNIPPGEYELSFCCIGFLSAERKITVTAGRKSQLTLEATPDGKTMKEVVVSGTLSEKERTESPVNVEVYNPVFFKKNPSPTLFESVGMINGVRPQLNCNVCNTGDIHMNGMEGPYTLVLIDGMPIISSLATVYGLMGIPNAIIERIEVMKGPASSLYGSEAMGGLINIITKNPSTAPRFSADFWTTSWKESNLDLSLSRKTGNRSQLLSGVNYFRYKDPADHNNDGFTDVTLQDRISGFAKWTVTDKSNRPFSLAMRYIYEDRWGGQTNWNKSFRGGDSIYAESIYTNRYELIGGWQLPFKEKINLQFSYNFHRQNSVYGTTVFNGLQHTSFAQLIHNKVARRHEWLSGLAMRYTWYDDDTPATSDANFITVSKPLITVLPGVFIQDEILLNDRNRLLLGYRADYHALHGIIQSPRVALKTNIGEKYTMRYGLGTGFRVVNIFTEDHASLTGAREVVIRETLKPEQSLNANINAVYRDYASGHFGGIDATAFCSYFINKINADYDTDPNKIIYDNLNGYAMSAGISVNGDITWSSGLKIMAGVSYMEVFQVEPDAAGQMKKTQQLHAPRWTGNSAVSYLFRNGLNVDLTANVYGPMRLPVLPNDYRPEYSPWFCIANVQLSYKVKKHYELYGGVKNLLNFVPSNPIMRPFDPFDKNVNDPVSNPFGYTFDPSYNYAPLQGIRLFIGIRLM